MKYSNLTSFSKEDVDKKRLVDAVLSEKTISSNVFYSKGEMYSADMDIVYDKKLKLSETEFQLKVCPKCGRTYPESENFCFDCLVNLKSNYIDIKSIDLNPEFKFKGKNSFNSFDDILTQESLVKINNNDFDLDGIVKDIKLKALKRFDAAIKDNNIDIDSEEILDKVLLYVKAFVNVDYKSYGPELGYYEFNRIHIDDRQLDGLQITTLIHELTHFLVKEILTHVLCSLLDAIKSRFIESIIAYILIASPVNQLLDEYAAHTTEGRFTIYGYQDYSSFLNIEKEIDMPKDDLEMIKAIGNSFANIIKDILEIYIDSDLLEEIKDQFKKDILDSPDYTNLMQENCMLLNDEGFKKAIIMVLSEGFIMASENTDKLNEYLEMW